jgi:hypothetical protein
MIPVTSAIFKRPLGVLLPSSVEEGVGGGAPNAKLAASLLPGIRASELAAAPANNSLRVIFMASDSSISK